MGGQAVQSFELDEQPGRKIAARADADRIDRAIDAARDQVVSAAVIEKPIELDIEAPVGAERRGAGPARIELQFDRGADRPVAGDLAGEKAAAEAGAAEQVFLARRQDVVAILAADRELQRRL